MAGPEVGLCCVLFVYGGRGGGACVLSYIPASTLLT